LLLLLAFILQFATTFTHFTRSIAAFLVSHFYLYLYSSTVYVGRGGGRKVAKKISHDDSIKSGLSKKRKRNLSFLLFFSFFFFHFIKKGQVSSGCVVYKPCKGGGKFWLN